MTAGDQATASRVVQIKPSVRIALLGGFDLIVNDVPVTAPVGSRRLLAFVALNHRTPVPRSLIAGSLWPKVPEHCAYTNLRAALCRLRGLGTRALDITATDVRLAPDVTVDVHDARMLAQHLLDPCVPPVALGLSTATVDQLSADLLPGWYDEWALLEADHWRQLRLHALEALTETFIDATEYAGAVVAAQAAVQADPLRESSQASLIRAYLAEGNPSEAVHHFERYVRRLRDELGLCPTQRLHQLVARVRWAGDGDAALRR
ncbi:MULTISPECIES: AfsR/SARP family transcriptional regulator [unclassified Streptomyces]|uniref:AfsR/SARP family transcriptional regulator n=1 Tax=unclassified Streptomyces TaxID=2593676 RepID=UPI002E2E338A|nr:MULTISPECIES: BTAD domain-containing putative transcriptional regulator [unclassified Streptomyces]WUB86255.1 SARP family transcriptional regulator [Streptomyces sp. NBC_00566]